MLWRARERQTRYEQELDQTRHESLGETIHLFATKFDSVFAVLPGDLSSFWRRRSCEWISIVFVSIFVVVFEDKVSSFFLALHIPVRLCSGGTLVRQVRVRSRSVVPVVGSEETSFEFDQR